MKRKLPSLLTFHARTTKRHICGRCPEWQIVAAQAPEFRLKIRRRRRLHSLAWQAHIRTLVKRKFAANLADTIDAMILQSLQRPREVSFILPWSTQ